METSQVLYRFNHDDYFLHQLEHMTQELKAISTLMDENNRQQRYGRLAQHVVHQHQWQHTPKTPTLLWPFSWLAAGIDGMLKRCDQAVARWVQEGSIATLDAAHPILAQEAKALLNENAVCTGFANWRTPTYFVR